MKKLILFFILSCKQATLLVEKQANDTLSFREKIQLRLHLKICAYCAKYKKQTEWLNNVLKKIWNNSNENVENPQENVEELKEKIIHKIEEQTKP